MDIKLSFFAYYRRAFISYYYICTIKLHLLKNEIFQL